MSLKLREEDLVKDTDFRVIFVDVITFPAGDRMRR
jgi:hypothetical protein